MPPLSRNSPRLLGNLARIQTVDLTDPTDLQELSPQTQSSNSASPTMAPCREATVRRGNSKRNASELEGSTPADSSAAGPSRKRLRNVKGESTSRENREADSPIAVDDVDDQDVLNTALRKQREEQVKAQVGADNQATKLSKLQCVICMDVFTDITATSCGHLFCHECLMSALRASEVRRMQAVGGHGKKSQCPVCRKSLDRSKKGDVIPLLIMKQGALTQPRRARGA